MTRTLMLIDGDGFLLNAALAAQKVIEWDDEVWTIHADLREAKLYLDAELNKVAGDEDFILCLSDPTRRYFRHEIFPDYKKARRGGEKPLCLKSLRNWVMEEFNVEERSGLEADDVMGILATDPRRDYDPIIVSVDKDMLQIPGKHINPSQLEVGIFEVDDVDADRFVYYQTLCGDSVDGYPGLRGVGPVKAKRILDEAEAEQVIYREATKAAFSKTSDLEDFVLQYNVARILHHKNYDFKAQRPILWPLKESLHG